jgi:hypothetical protein
MVDEKANLGRPFRQQALEHVSVTQPLEGFIQIPGFTAWGVLAGLGLCMISLLFWLFCGSIVIQQSGKGIMLSSHEAVVYIPAWQNKKIQAGMKVYANAGGHLMWLSKPISGKVESVENLALNPQNAFNTITNNPAMTVRVYFSKEIAPGSLIEVRINLRRQTPWSLFMSRQLHA